MEDKYLLRGVSAKKEDVHKAIERMSHGLYPKMFCKVYPDWLAGNEDFVNLMSSDGSGTKSILAYLYWKETGDASIFRGIGQDALVMNLDDMMCVGATSNFLFTSLINRNKLRIDGSVIKEIIEGTQEYIEKLSEWGVNIFYTGGETADVGDLVRTISVDASMASRMPKKDLIFTNNIKPGMVVVGFSSGGNCIYENEYNSGIGSNGLTSARHDLLSHFYYSAFPETIEKEIDSKVQYNGKHRLTDIVFDQHTLGKMILSPTMSYAPILKKVLETYKGQIASIVHCTGGGAGKVLHFAEQVKIVKNNWLEIPPIFELIQKESNTSWEEMFRVFNMGVRLEMYMESEAIANEIIQISKSFNIEAQIIGYTEASENAHVEIHHQNNKIILKP
jgi:phosphoribosylformylglycinamidine cyclo-ligase